MLPVGALEVITLNCGSVLDVTSLPLSEAGVVGLGPILTFLFSLSSVLYPRPSC